MHDLAASYAEVLVHHVETGDGSDLARAYEIARTALAEGLGILDVAHLHVQALGQLGEPPPEPARVRSVILEALAPFELTHRG
jgi:hypothetical protein